MFTTPPGMSEVAIASASSIAASGPARDATATTVLPDTRAGRMRETIPSSDGSAGGNGATTPTGAVTVKLRYGADTRDAPPKYLASVCVQPAYHAARAIDRL